MGLLSTIVSIITLKYWIYCSNESAKDQEKNWIRKSVISCYIFLSECFILFMDFNNYFSCRNIQITGIQNT